ncbi:hypothetical protein F4781DRAFT_218178 [Annulohypoxylon bovei var. microspora]|nr:hypothetical protein F4781DRAFT_218178 [Annulohypoxylon bovei var. microspora]
MWSSNLSPFLLALATTTCGGSPLYAMIPTIAPIPSLTITPSLLNASQPPSTASWSRSHVTLRTPLPLPLPSTAGTNASSTGVIPVSRAARGDIHSAVTTATLYSDGHAYTVTQFSEVNPELSTIGLTTTVRDGTVVTAPATMPVVSGTSGTGSPWRTSETSTTARTESDDDWSSRVSVGLPTMTGR